MNVKYGLYLLAIVCFVLAGILFTGYAGYMQLTTGNEVADLVITLFSTILGVIFVGIGYGAGPKKRVLTRQPLPEPSVKSKSSPIKSKMTKCPHCGSDIAKPRKSWKMAGRPDRTGKKTELTIGLFDCPNCNKTSRVVLDKRKI